VRCIVGGDGISLSIAAASIAAKVTRDRLMTELDVECPGYGFARHKGYGTAAHAEALARLGPSPHHRFSFAPIRALRTGSRSAAANI
jgi:ribonuclease HII